jgi:hypothetical protein
LRGRAVAVDAQRAGRDRFFEHAAVPEHRGQRCRVGGDRRHRTGLGGKVIAAPDDAPPFRRAVLAAPDGATFSISELRLPA